MARALWSGSIAFGLVNVPDGSPIGYDRVCKAERPAGAGLQIVKVFEIERGEFVNLRTHEEIDPILFERTYYLTPQEGEAPSDLLEALRARVPAARTRRGGNRRQGRNLSVLSKEELYELATAADIPSRSDMSKDQFVDALEAA